MRMKIGGKVYRVTRQAPSRKVHAENDGEIDYDRKKIFIHPALKGTKLLEILIHEGLHASFPVLDEEAVRVAAREIARLAVKFGFSQCE